MNINKMHFPHPVLQSQYKDKDSNFNNSIFDVSINYEMIENGSELKLEAIFDLYNDDLNKLIVTGEAVFSLLFVCESTSTRILKQTHLYEDVFIISTRMLNKTVTVYPFILASGDIKKYHNADLIEPINTLCFEIKRGDKLAIGQSYELYIEREPLFEIESIFEIVELKEKNAPLLSFNPDNPKIQIFLPTDTYEKVKVIANYTGPVNHILIGLLYLPAVIDALLSISALNSESDGDIQLLEYKDYNWYRTLEFKLEDLKLGDDLSEIGEDNIIDIAHRLMENPNEKALDAIDELLMRMEEDL